MEIRLGRPKRAVGYIRVSTQGQADDGCGLEFQAECILTFAGKQGYVQTMIYEDIASGSDRKAMKERPGFRAAVEEARRIGGVIIVARMDRVSRNGDKFLEFCRTEKVRIVSTVPGETDKLGNAYGAVSKAQAVRENISGGTKRSLAGVKARGKPLGNSASLPAANRASSKARTTASHLKVLDIRDFLLSLPEQREKTVAEIADLLNQVGILSGRGLPWTTKSLRRQLGLARDELKLLDDPDEDI